MGIPSIADLNNIYIPPPLAVLELNLGDQWRARFSEGDELPPNAPLAYGYAVVFMGDKGYVTRRGDDGPWGVLEGAFNAGEKPRAWLKRLATEQFGATPGQVELIGYLDCKATSHNSEFPPGTITVRPLYVVAAKAVKDLGESSGYVRRRLPLNEHAEAVRKRYPELAPFMSMALNRYAVWRARGEA